MKTTNLCLHAWPLAPQHPGWHPSPLPFAEPPRSWASSYPRLILLQAGPTNSNSAAPGSLFHL